MNQVEAVMCFFFLSVAEGQRVGVVHVWQQILKLLFDVSTDFVVPRPAPLTASRRNDTDVKQKDVVWSTRGYDFSRTTCPRIRILAASAGACSAGAEGDATVENGG